MKTKSHVLGAIAVLLLGALLFATLTASTTKRTIKPEKGCVYMTVMGEQQSKGFGRYHSDKNIKLAVRDGLKWLSEAQLPNGGYGAGSHSAQHVRNPQAVKADPATTAMVGMALLRSGTTLKTGTHSKSLKRALAYLLETIENVEDKNPYITTIQNTQIQTKLGQNIDAVLAAQFLSKVLERDLENMDRKRVVRCLDLCISRIQKGTDKSGKQRGAGWAGVLQSGMANSALEAAQAVGASVNVEVLENAKKYQKDNYNENDGSVNADDGAGIILYAVSGSVRASAKEARKAKADFDRAKAEGRIDAEAEINAETLEEIGYVSGDAQKYGTAYKVYESAKKTAQNDKVLDGFGNNGGEEFLSYLQTGESLIVGDDEDWKSWYNNMSGRILKIQNKDGSWSGHHCITSPVFCTATSLLLLTVEEDLAFLKKIGAEQ